jgi:hypothetical protein
MVEHRKVLQNEHLLRPHMLNIENGSGPFVPMLLAESKHCSVVLGADGLC